MMTSPEYEINDNNMVEIPYRQLDDEILRALIEELSPATVQTGTREAVHWRTRWSRSWHSWSMVASESSMISAVNRPICCRQYELKRDFEE